MFKHVPYFGQQRDTETSRSDRFVAAESGQEAIRMQPEIQSGLKIGRPGDKYEQEADRVADTVMRMPDPQLRRPFAEEEEEKIQMQPIGEEQQLQMQPVNEEQAQVREATESERRGYVREAIGYFQNADAFFQQASFRNDKMLVSILRGWHETILHNENIINTYLNEDATLLRELRQAFTTGLRNLMTRASAQLNEPTVRLYLQNMHLIPEWAWPGTADFNLATDQEKRDFIQATANAFNDATTFSGFTTFTDATLRDVLTRLRDLLHSQLEIIKGDLGNDQSLRDNLHNAYQAALDRLLSAAAPQMGQSVTQLYIQYMDLIPEGMENYEPGISTPVPSGVTPDASGNVVFTINGIEITILPDSAHAGSGAETSFNFSRGNINGNSRNGVITSFTGPDPSTVTIQTKYNPDMSAGSTSGYGRGTTAADQARGNTSLGFHESRHGLDFIRYIRDHQPPTFDGAVGDSVADFRAKANDWQQAWQDYSDDMDETSLQDTDCVGTTIDQYNADQSPPVVTHHCP